MRVFSPVLVAVFALQSRADSSLNAASPETKGLNNATTVRSSAAHQYAIPLSKSLGSKGTGSGEERMPSEEWLVGISRWLENQVMEGHIPIGGGTPLHNDHQERDLQSLLREIPEWEKKIRPLMDNGPQFANPTIDRRDVGESRAFALLQRSEDPTVKAIGQELMDKLMARWMNEGIHSNDLFKDLGITERTLFDPTDLDRLSDDVLRAYCHALEPEDLYEGKYFQTLMLLFGKPQRVKLKLSAALTPLGTPFYHFDEEMGTVTVILHSEAQHAGYVKLIDTWMQLFVLKGHAPNEAIKSIPYSSSPLTPSVKVILEKYVLQFNSLWPEKKTTFIEELALLEP